jgi:hypothetical protein
MCDGVSFTMCDGVVFTMCDVVLFTMCDGVLFTMCELVVFATSGAGPGVRRPARLNLCSFPQVPLPSACDNWPGT